MAKIVYDPRKSGIENLNIILVDAGIPEELLDDVEITGVKEASGSKYAKYADKAGNTALEVEYTGELQKLSGLSANVHFYDRVPPIPEPWKNQVMMVQDTELKNIDLATYIKDRFTRDGYSFVGERLTFELESGGSLLSYGRNKVVITAPYRSYGLVGSAKLNVQYYVNLKDKTAKIVTVINPFLTQDGVYKRTGYSELAMQPKANYQETEAAILNRFLKESYGLSRAQAILDEIKVEQIALIKVADFKSQLLNPANEEQELEAKLAKDYKQVALYTLDKDQSEDDSSKVFGNIRMVVAKQDISKLVVSSGKYELDEDEGYRFKSQGVRRFVLVSDKDEGCKIEINLGKVKDIATAYTNAKAAIEAYFGDAAKYFHFEKGSATQTETIIELTPAESIEDYVVGELEARVTYQIEEEDNNTPSPNPQPPKLVIKQNLNGFSRVEVL